MGGYGLCMLSWSVLLTALPSAGDGAEWNLKEDFWPDLVQAVPDIIRSQDQATGRFGSGIWIVTDQNVIFPLAVVWSQRHPSNPYFHRDDVLNAIMAGGDALIADQDERGQWEFRKKDGSTWGPIFMPWIYSRWVRAFGLIREAMPAERRERWEAALRLGYEGIADTALRRIHNIPAHHAMGLYHAGQLLDRPEWCAQAQAFMAEVCAHQNPGGYWSEHLGPVVAYNFTYTDALGVYYAISGDASVLPALNRAAAFHTNFTYPDGSRLETIDERNPYHSGVSLGTVGFSFSAEGRGFLQQQLQRLRLDGKSPSADVAAAFVLYGQNGPVAALPAGKKQHHSTLGQDEAVINRRGPWFTCISAFHCPVLENRWIQDRQNLVSLFHDRVGLIVGGGNTKLQPLWSTFSVGDVSLLSHRPGDSRPEFTAPAGLWHVPNAAELDPRQLRLKLAYGPEQCHVHVEVSDPRRAELTYEATVDSGRTVEAHVTLLPHLGEDWETASGRRGTLGAEPVRLTAGECGGWFSHHGWRISVPDSASVLWPVLPHNPYRKDGHATPEEGRIVMVLPFSEQDRQYKLAVEVATATR